MFHFDIFTVYIKNKILVIKICLSYIKRWF